MKALSVFAIAAVCILGGSGCMSEHYATHSQRSPQDSLAIMTTADVIALSKAGIGSDVILMMISKSGSTFRLHTPDVILLADSGVSDTVIHAMLDANGSLRAEERTTVARYYPPDYYWWFDYPYYDSWYWSGFYRWPGPRYSFHVYGGFHGGRGHR